MIANPHYRCTIVHPGVEVVTVRTSDGRFETEIHGGKLDGERFVCDREQRYSQHEAAVVMMRLVARRRFDC